MKRRDFVKLLGITPGAMAAPWSLAEAQERLLGNLLVPQDGIPPDQWVIHRTTCTECPAGCGVLVKAREGRPIKLEGDPEHPVNAGGLCMRGQASLGRLYHPERLRQPMAKAEDGSWQAIGWEDALGRVRSALTRAGEAGARNVYLSSRTTGSLARLVGEFGTSMDVEILPEYELFNHGALRAAYETVYGLRAVPSYHINRADLLITFGADLLDGFVNPVRFAREYAEALENGLVWHHMEPNLSLTGSNATHRHVIRAGSEPWLIAHLLRNHEGYRRLPSEVRAALPEFPVSEVAERTGLTGSTVDELVRALNGAQRPLVIAGGVATASEGGLIAALLAALLQEATGSVGTLVDFSESEDFDRVGTLTGLRAETESLSADNPGVVFLSRVHSLDTLPAMSAALEAATLGVGMTDFIHPPMEGCDLLLPLSHGLETWGDASPRRGLRSRIRPAFSPLFDTRSEGEILLALMGESRTWKEYLDTDWQSSGADPERDPLVETRPGTVRVGLQSPTVRERLSALWPGHMPSSPALVLVPSLRTWDGRSRVITLLHEIPDPLSAVTYGAYVSISESQATGLGISDGDGVVVETSGGSLELAARVQPGLPEGVVQISVDHAEGLSLPVDRDTGEAVRCLGGIRVRKSGARPLLTILAGSMEAEGRGILPGDVHHAPGQEQREAEHGGEPERLYPTPEHDTYRWAMAIDLDRCTGCSACVAGCYVENNIPMVGPAEHELGREMSWLRIQPYLDGDRPIEFIPVMCQHCGNAPCETVCPVYATYHNPEGLNAQVYNRCVGTRYCSNNCPYKVRRFNWFDHDRPEPLDLLVNPDVSIRPRGVMEKCTFCVQRIREAKDTAKDEDRLVGDGEFTTACAESCPTDAIVFGNLLDENSEVHRLAQSAQSYRILESLGTEPAVHYLRKDDGHE